MIAIKQEDGIVCVGQVGQLFCRGLHKAERWVTKRALYVPGQFACMPLSCDESTRVRADTNMCGFLKYKRVLFQTLDMT